MRPACAVADRECEGDDRLKPDVVPGDASVLALVPEGQDSLLQLPALDPISGAA